MSKALYLTGGPEAEKTVEFVDMMDKFFDCLNVANIVAVKHSQKAFKAPYRLEVTSGLRYCNLYVYENIFVLIRTFSGVLISGESTVYSSYLIDSWVKIST